ncbi:PREDICTED: uncharacterized protein LOC104816660 [Tarenaya hassleriana]|uniref:uncharacterized protein LOC104816660 n=1 Tax=Tarenaya hassleriana TaxID=28532 RepID=UPI00053C3112|nr:PREDICTED: uncharacterized protein LOC104816660 [Tarenaya hassleriana]
MAHQQLLALCFLLTCAAVAASSLAESMPPLAVARKIGGHLPSQEGKAPAPAEEAEVRRSHHHSTVDRSVAGGGVILGGLATTFLVAVFCYIRATRKHSARNDDTVNVTPASSSTV